MNDNKALQTQTINQAIINNLVLDGDISKMKPEQKVSYITKLCDSLGLNPLTQPFQIIAFQGKQKLYATKDCTEQLRKIHGVSVIELDIKIDSGVYIVKAKVADKTGRTDISTGAIDINNLKGLELANAIMKGETKAKRRATLSICGLGMLDESEIPTMEGAEIVKDTFEVKQIADDNEGCSDGPEPIEPTAEDMAKGEAKLEIDNEGVEKLYAEFQILLTQLPKATQTLFLTEHKKAFKISLPTWNAEQLKIAIADVKTMLKKETVNA